MVALVVAALGVDGLVAAPADAQGVRRPRARKVRKARHVRPNLPPGFVWPPSTHMLMAGDRCLDALTRLGVAWRAPAAPVRQVAAPVIVDSMQLGKVKLTPISRKPPFVMDCHLARALAETSHLFAEAGIRELRFAGIHDYRRVRLRGRSLGVLSRHAFGLAIDVYEMTDTAGNILKVRTHYRRVAALRSVEQRLRETGAFRQLLTPGNDRRSHYDHFHLEAQMVLDTVPPPAGVPGQVEARR